MTTFIMMMVLSLSPSIQAITSEYTRTRGQEMIFRTDCKLTYVTLPIIPALYLR